MNPLQPTKVWVNTSDGGIEPKELYCFTHEELNMLLGGMYNKCWEITGDGWNGEIAPLGCMTPADKESFD